MRRSAIVLAILLVVASLAGATPITPTLVDCVVGCGDPNVAPYLSSGSNQNVVFRFQVPDYRSIGTINSVTVNYTVFDNARGDGRETGRIVLIGEGSEGESLSIIVGPFGPLNNTDSSNPFNGSGQISDPADMAALQNWIENHGGHFRVRVRETSGDYYVGSVSVDMDVTAASAVPEPATFALIGFGLVGLALVRKRTSH